MLIGRKTFTYCFALLSFVLGYSFGVIDYSLGSASGVLGSLFAQEQIRLTTYYPAPFGVYRDLLAKKMAVGDVNGDGKIDNADLTGLSDDDFVVKGRFGIGVATPSQSFNMATEDGTEIFLGSPIYACATDGAEGVPMSGLYLKKGLLNGDTLYSAVAVDWNIGASNNSEVLSGATIMDSSGNYKGTYYMYFTENHDDPSDSQAGLTLLSDMETSGFDIITNRVFDKVRLQAIGDRDIEFSYRQHASPPYGNSDYMARMYHQTGNLRVRGTVIASGFSWASDIRLKKDIENIDNALDKVNELQGVRFRWKRDNKLSIGLIAQEVEKVLPELVSEDDKGYKFVNYGEITALLIEAVKEQQKQIEFLKKELSDKRGQTPLY